MMIGKKFSYLSQEIFYKVETPAWLLLSCFYANRLTHFPINLTDMDQPVYYANYLFYTYCVMNAGMGLLRHTALSLNKIGTTEKENNPLEYLKGFDITDRQGLACILEKTAAKEKREWGTVLKVAPTGDASAEVSEVMEPEAAMAAYVKRRSESTILFDHNLVREKGYLGFQHYHPFGLRVSQKSAKNYSVSIQDRLAPKNNSLNMITFNMPRGPELIAYNKRFTFLPQNPEKTQFARASRLEILNYLEN